MDLPTLSAPSLDTVRKGASLVRLSIFWRIVLTSLLIIVVMAGVNFYALFQLRQLSAMSTTLASQHYPAIEQAKRVQAVAFNQLNSEKKYLAVRDPTFLQHFDEEVEEYHRGIENLLRQETSPEGRQLLEQAKRYQQERLLLFHAELEHTAASPGSLSPDYETRRNEVMDHMTATLDHYVDFHEAAISAGVSRSRESSAQAEAITEQLVLLALRLRDRTGRYRQLHDSSPSPSTPRAHQTNRTGKFSSLLEHQGSQRTPRPRRHRQLDGR